MLLGMDDDRLIGADEASQMLHIDRSTLTRWVRGGKIPAAHKQPGVTGLYLFRYSAVAQLVNQRKSA